MQSTVDSAIFIVGTGLHSGRPVRMTIRPAPAGQGVLFRRTDVTGADPVIAARWDNVVPSPLCTRIENAGGTSVSTIEHVMSALAGLGIGNATIDVDGPEVPILDGSALPFVRAILARGIRRLDAPVRALEIVSPVEVSDGAATARLEPAEGLEIAFEIDFDEAAIGRQVLTLDMANGTFVRELAASRTFCRLSDVDAMRAAGLARGGTLENAVVFDGDTVLTPGGLRQPDEAVRHKMLDAMGDLALAGMPILGRYVGRRAGHALTNRLLRKVFATRGATQVVAVEAAEARRLPGVGVTSGDVAAAA